MFAGKNITLLIGGSIAAYKSAELVRELVKQGARVHVVMSEAATKFISSLTLQTLSGNPVTTDLFDERKEGEISHIWLADHADLVLVAPATADIIAKVAAGLAGDALTAVLLATKAPIVIAPAMNVNMWSNQITQGNVAKLRSVGMHFVEPEEGELACGWVGQGRLAENESILSLMAYVLAAKDLRGSHVVVTAGPTREPIDPIRFVSNRSSGRMGYALAQVAYLRGAHVSLISGPTSLAAPAGVEFYRVNTAAEMRAKVFELVMRVEPQLSTGSRPSQFVFMAAAVTDHSPVAPAKSKIKHDKSKSYALEMEPSPDILKELGARRSEIEQSSQAVLKLVGFAAETSEDDAELIGWATEKLKNKNADLMVGNPANESFERNTNRVWLLDQSGRQEEIATADKEVVASKIISAALRV